VTVAIEIDHTTTGAGPWQGDAGVAATETHGAPREPVQGAINLGLREERGQRDERQEQRGRKARDDLLHLHAAEINAHDPREHDREHADVDVGKTTDHQRGNERAQ